MFTIISVKVYGIEKILNSNCLLPKASSLQSYNSELS